MPNWLQYLTGWLRTDKGVPVERFDIADLAIRFVGEQDGAMERELKDRLSSAFPLHRVIQRAYLARVRYGNEESDSVALCLRCEPAFDEVIVAAAGAVFHEMFNHSQHLDIMPVTEKQERELVVACRPFYSRNEDSE